MAIPRRTLKGLPHEAFDYRSPENGIQGAGVSELKVSPAPYVTIPLAAQVTGFTEKAIRRKIEEGVWLEGREFVKAPDGHILISIKGYSQWVEKGWVSRSANDPSASHSPLRANPSAARSS
jgi:hypothetical protein